MMKRHLSRVTRMQKRAYGNADNLPEHTMARPPNSAAVYRSVQDYKPSIHKVAHADGKSMEYDESVSMMHFILIDAFGFRWPVRLSLRPGLTLFDVINSVDSEWFGIRPTFPNQHTKNHAEVRKDTLFRNFITKCAYGHPSVYRCNTCAVLVPYEYLDAMSPPSERETQWLSIKTRHHVRLPSNARVACQVLIEDWMNGMTIAVPQVESLAYQMYYQMGADPDTIHAAQGFSLTGVRNWSDGYTFPLDPRGDGTEGQKNRAVADSYLDDHAQREGNSVSLSECFWKDNVDDIIRVKYPDWKGAYEYANK